MGNKTTTSQQPKYAQLFLIVLSIYTVMFIAYHIFSVYNLSLSQDRIKDNYTEHITRVDTFYNECNNVCLNLLQSHKDESAKIDSIFNSVILQNSIFTRSQVNNLIEVSNLYHKRTDLLYEEYSNLVKDNTLRLDSEKRLLEEQTIAMLDLHLNKVEHEYSNLTIWAAVLTILFLVFSFYSIYKMDELIQQGNEGVKDIRSLKKNSEDLIGKLETTSKSEIEKTRTQIDGFIKEQQNRMMQILSYFEKENTNKLSDINKCFEDACNIVEQIKNLKNTIESENNQSKK